MVILDYLVDKLECLILLSSLFYSAYLIGNHVIITQTVILLVLLALFINGKDSADRNFISFIVRSNSFRSSKQSGIFAATCIVPFTLMSRYLCTDGNEVGLDFFRWIISVSLMLSISLVLDYIINFYIVRYLKHTLPGLMGFSLSCLCSLIISGGTWRQLEALVSLHAVHRLLVLLGPRNFTLAESFILSSIFGLSFIFQASYINHRLSFNDLFLLLGMLLFQSMLIVAACLYPLLRYILRLYEERNSSRHIALSVIFFLLYGGLSLGLWIKASEYIHNVNALTWALRFIFSSDHLFIIGWWAISLSSIVLSLTTTFQLIVQRITKFSLNFFPQSFERLIFDLKRKAFHLLACVIFLPSVIYGSKLLTFGFCIAFSLFFTIELLRIFRVAIIFASPYSIDRFFRQFIEMQPISSSRSNEQVELTPYPSESAAVFFRSWDLGPFILSHIYLLLACALPHVLASNINSMSRSSVNVFSSTGIISIGIGDTFAAIVGHMFGRTKWPGRSKSIEGTVAFILSSWTLYTFLDSQNALQYFMLSLISAILEAVSYQNDNLVISLWTCSFGIVLNK